MAGHAAMLGRRRSGWLAGWPGRLLILFLLTLVSGVAGAPIAYMLWPAPKPIAAHAPSLPITVGGVVFNVPPAAIRVGMQRHPGTQARIDLVFLWPSLRPPDGAARPSPHAMPDLSDRLFVTVSASDGTLAPLDRLRVIYPRYTAGTPVVGPDGLAVQTFRPGSPYQEEDLIHHPASAERFLLRCTRPGTPTPATCLHERRIGGADVTVRFPRQWLANWTEVADSIDRLLANLKPSEIGTIAR
jgi:hypothetical protein